MSLIKCPKCGEMFSDSYKTCPFCEEDEAYYSGKARKGRGRRTAESSRRRAPSILGPVAVVVLILLVLLVVWLIFGDRIKEAIEGTEKPPVTDVDTPDDSPVTTPDDNTTTTKPNDTTKPGDTTTTKPSTGSVDVSKLTLESEYGTTIKPNDGTFDISLPAGLSCSFTVKGTDMTAAWSSADSSIATVSADGTVKTVSRGETTLTIKLGSTEVKCLLRVTK